MTEVPQITREEYEKKEQEWVEWKREFAALQDAFTPADYRKFVQSRMTRLGLEENLTHFSMGLAREYSEYFEAQHFRLNWSQIQAWPGEWYHWMSEKLELGDMLFYAYALAEELILVPDVSCFKEQYELCGRLTEARFDYVMSPHKLRHSFALDEVTKPLDVVLKWRFHGATLNLEKLIRAVSSVLNVCYSLARQDGHNLTREVMFYNVRKLTKRHPTEFTGVAWKNDRSATPG